VQGKRGIFPDVDNSSMAESEATPSLDEILERNIRSLVARRREDDAAVNRQMRFAATITSFVGSMGFVYAHAIIFGFWIVANLWGLPGIPRFDPQLIYIATFASLEAIFLSTFVLITQNRMAATADKRDELALQIGLLTEHELTKLIPVVAAMAKRMGVTTEVDEELAELKQDVAVNEVLDKIESADTENREEAAVGESEPDREPVR
jgi:uncharacterized membrane protein